MGFVELDLAPSQFKPGDLIQVDGTYKAVASVYLTSVHYRFVQFDDGSEIKVTRSKWFEVRRPVREEILDETVARLLAPWHDDIEGWTDEGFYRDSTGRQMIRITFDDVWKEENTQRDEDINNVLAKGCIVPVFSYTDTIAIAKTDLGGGV